MITHIRFDELYYEAASNRVVNPSTYAESWSGYALMRSGAIVQPYAVPMLDTNSEFRIDPERGAIRLWFRPDWSSLSTMLGAGSGNTARLLTLATTNGSSSATWWTLAFGANGNSIQLQAQGATGPAVIMSAPTALQAGTWHLLVLGYTETNSALYIDGAQVAAGAGVLPVPTNAAPYTSLFLGSGLTGMEPVGGQIEEVGIFTGSRRYCVAKDMPFGLTQDWEITYYYTSRSVTAAMGPVSEAEIAADEARREQEIAEMQAARQATAATMTLAPTMDAAPPPYDPSQGFWLTTPVVEGTNISFSLMNGDPSIGYDIYYTPTLAPTDWRIIATGTVAQSSYTVPRVGTMGFLRGAVGGDWDGDGIPNWMDANPKNPAVGALTLTIDAPANGANIQ